MIRAMCDFRRAAMPAPGAVRFFGIALAISSLVLPATRAEELGPAVEKLAKAQAELKSYAAKYKATTQVSTTMAYEVQGVFEWMRLPEGVAFRNEIRRKATHDLGGEKMVVEEHQTTLSDGKFHYQIRHDTGNVLKQKADPASPEGLGVEPLVAQLQQTYNEIKVLPDEKVAGHDCVVIEASGSYMEESPDDPTVVVQRETIWFAKDTGMTVRMQAMDKAGKVVQSREYSDIVKDARLDAARFEFKPPLGANIQDRSGE